MASSAEQTADFLRSQDFEVVGPNPGTITFESIEETLPELWQIVSLKEPILPDNAIFFIQYHSLGSLSLKLRHILLLLQHRNNFQYPASDRYP